ncbi:MAG: ABC transporter permease [Chloroflexi bacterium]|nr:ABC transporter permease [Chloroflexota bacterium]
MAIKELELAEGKRTRSRGPLGRAWSRLIRKKIALICMGAIVTIYMAGVLAPWIAPQGYTEQNLLATLKGPSLDHFLGTDRLGRDVFSRVLFGIQTTVIVTFAATATGGLFLGILLGLLSGYFGKMLDSVIMRIGEIFASFPDILLVILIAATVKGRITEWLRAFEDATGIEGLVRSGVVDYLVVFGALAAFGWIGMARLVRGQILYLKETQFVEAARAIGASAPRIMLIHLLPNAISPIIVSVSMGMGAIVGAEIVLSWLGIGINPPRPSLGNMIFENGNLGVLRQHPHLLLAPIVVAWLLIFTWNLLGDALNDVLNPRTR